MIAYQSFKPAFDRLFAEGFTPTADLPESADLAVVHITRSREETLGLIAAAWRALSLGGWLIVDGDKSDGIDGIWKQLRKALPGALQDSKAHGRVIWVQKSGGSLPDWQSALAPTVNADGFITTAGVFSADRVDQGSAQLAQHLAGALKGRGADFGAGWGWLSAQALQQNPAIEALDLIEAERRALDCAQANVTDTRARFLWADATSAQGDYDFIVMNPPFHEGRKPDPSLGRAFIAAAASALATKGALWLVANRQLAYEDTLAQYFATVEPLSQSGRFKVIRARKPRA